MTFLGEKYETYRETPMILKKADCEQMINSRRCDGEAMECDTKTYRYDVVPQPEFVWVNY